MAPPRRASVRSPRLATRPQRSRSLAKLTRPRLGAPYHRERLFSLLDAVRARPVVWVGGPPGAGKTTLAATWVEARRIPGLWYQLDSADSDPATFFYYLKRAADAAGCTDGPRLPLLTPDYRRDVPAFARRWFRELFSMLPPGSALCLDNYQDLSADSPLHRVLATACNEIPASAQLLVMSWADPPAEFARALVQERLARLDPDALRLTEDEALGLVEVADDLVPEQIQEIHAACRGWAAGFTLLRERARRTGVVGRVDDHATMQEVFDYFMEQVFRDASVESRETLLKTALLPRFTEAMAVEQTDNHGAGDLMRSFHRRHLFVDRRRGAEVIYEYHGLFRAFLLDECRRHYTPVEVAELSARAATVLEKAGWREEALEVLLREGDHDRAADLLECLAPSMIAVGRGDVLEQALRRISPAVRDAHPVLSYWLGASLAYWHQPQARAAYERAYDGFLRDDDRAGQVMALTGVLYVLSVGWSNSMNEFDTIRRSVDALEPLLSTDLVFPSVEIAVRAYAPLFILLTYHLPDSPLLPLCKARLEALLQQQVEEDDTNLLIALVLIEYYGLAGYVHEAERVIAASEPLAESSRVSQLTRGMWWFHGSWSLFAAGDLARVRERLERALSIGAEDRLRGSEGAAFCQLWASVQLAGVALDLGDLHAVASILDSLERTGAASAGPQASASMHWIRARLAAARGDLDEALFQSEQACSLSGMAVILFGTQCATTLISVLIERGELGRARELLERMRHVLPADRFPLRAIRVEFLEGLLGAASDPGWRARVTAALRRLHELGVQHPLPSQPLLLRQVAELLLAEKIEVPYVRAWIRSLHPKPSRPDVPGWPWAVRIRTLGPFSVAVDEAPIAFVGKTPRKPLQLLQVLVAGGGEGVSSEVVSQALWPDADGDAAAAALRTTVSRLRGVLEHDAINVSDGKLSLDRRFCWVDVWSLRDLRREIDRRAPTALASSALDVYRGPFLENEREEGWMLSARERLRRDFAAVVAAIAHRLEQDVGAAEATAFRRSAAERDAAAFEPRRFAATSTLGR